jgi:hypothetical protein
VQPCSSRRWFHDRMVRQENDNAHDPTFAPLPAFQPGAGHAIVASLIASQLPLGRLARLTSSSASGGAQARSLERMATAVDPLSSPIHGGERGFGPESVDCVRERKLQA